jgi:hypothetical protein
VTEAAVQPRRATRLNGQPCRLSSQTAAFCSSVSGPCIGYPLTTSVTEIIERGVALTL